MICLECGHRQRGKVENPCSSCGSVFQTVGGIYGVNNITQLLDAIEHCRSGTLSLDSLIARFDAFAEHWESFQKRWGLDKGSVPELFELSAQSQGIYEEPLGSLGEAFTHLDDAFAILDELESPESEALDRLADHLRQFFRGICSTAAILFKKLENKKGDFTSLLHNFGF